MSKEDLRLPNAPFFHVLAATVSEATDFGWSLALQDERIVVRFLRGRKMTKLNSLFDEWAAALQFPYYFGENWNAFYDCMTDLEWLPGGAYVLMITDSRALLSEEDGEQLDALINTLQEAGAEWSRLIETTEAWSRPAVAFHVIFQCEESDKREVMSRLASINTSFKELRLPSA